MDFFSVGPPALHLRTQPKKAVRDDALQILGVEDGEKVNVLGCSASLVGDGDVVVDDLTLNVPDSIEHLTDLSRLVIGFGALVIVNLILALGLGAVPVGNPSPG